MKFIVSVLFALGFASAHADTYPQDKAYELFANQYANDCEIQRAKEMKMDSATAFTDGQKSYQLFTFICNTYAYNVSAVHFLSIGGATPKAVTFAVPKYKVDEKTSKVTVTGIGASDTIVPYVGDLDTKTLLLDTFHKGRGVGDAFDAGTYKFENGEFVLKKYLIDATYDGEINPVTVIDYK